MKTAVQLDFLEAAPRIRTQLERVLMLMGDHRWHTLAELAERCGCSEAGASARIRDLRKPPHELTVERRRIRTAAGLYEYRVPDERTTT